MTESEDNRWYEEYEEEKADGSKVSWTRRWRRVAVRLRSSTIYESYRLHMRGVGGSHECDYELGLPVNRRLIPPDADKIDDERRIETVADITRGMFGLIGTPNDFEDKAFRIRLTIRVSDGWQEASDENNNNLSARGGILRHIDPEFDSEWELPGPRFIGELRIPANIYNHILSDIQSEIVEFPLLEFWINPFSTNDEVGELDRGETLHFKPWAQNNLMYFASWSLVRGMIEWSAADNAIVEVVEDTNSPLAPRDSAVEHLVHLAKWQISATALIALGLLFRLF